MTAVGITGHQQIPAVAQEYVVRELRAKLEPLGSDVVGYTSLAEGADQLFAEIVLAHGGRLIAIIPARNYETSFTGAAALQRYRTLVRRASRVHTLEHAEPSEDAYLDAGRRVADAADLVLAVWDGKAAKGRGGTGDVVRYARKHGKEVEVIWPSGVER